MPTVGEFGKAAAQLIQTAPHLAKIPFEPPPFGDMGWHAALGHGGPQRRLQCRRLHGEQFVEDARLRDIGFVVHPNTYRRSGSDDVRLLYILPLPIIHLPGHIRQWSIENVAAPRN